MPSPSTPHSLLTTHSVPPSDLVPHAKVKHLIGRWSLDSDEARALRRSIKERGVLQPVIITEQREIVDGVTRWMACKALQIEVPCVVRPEEEALAIVLESEIHRRHSTKSQLAFRLAPMIEDAWAAARDRQYAMLSGPVPATGYEQHHVAKTVDEYATELGISREWLKRARELHALFAQHESVKWDWDAKDLEAIGVDRKAKLTFREYFTAKILDPTDPMGLGGALSGLKQKLSQEHWAGRGRPHKGGRPEDESQQLYLFNDAWATLGKRWEYWQRMDEDQRETARQSVAVALDTAPTEVLVAMKKRVDALLKERAKASE